MTINSIDKAILVAGTTCMTIVSLHHLNNFLLLNPTQTKKNLFVGLNFSILFGGCVLMASNLLHTKNYF